MSGKKEPLAPGHGLSEWYKLISTMEPPTERIISVEELRKHDGSERSGGVLWIEIKGVVYDVTEYQSYHPGGTEGLKTVAGKDGTVCFNQTHRWVNVEKLLEKHVVGRVKYI